jgi:hypothetical protein
MNQVATRFDELEAKIAELPQAEFETVGHFAPGVYARELRLPAGALLTGKIHKTEHLNIVCGDITVHNVEEGTTRRICGHEIFVSKPGTRRAGFTHRPTIWTTIHPTEETDVDKIEQLVIEPHVNPLLGNREELK